MPLFQIPLKFVDAWLDRAVTVLKAWQVSSRRTVLLDFDDFFKCGARSCFKPHVGRLVFNNSSLLNVQNQEIVSCIQR